MAYRIYITDLVKELFVGQGGKVSKRWIDIVHQKPKQFSRDNRSGDEIAADILTRLRAVYSG